MRLGEFSHISYGYTAKASFEAQGPKFLRITDIQNGSVEWQNVPTCAIDEKELAKHRLQENDIVFARTGATTGKSYLIMEPPESVAASYLIRLRVENNDIDPAFVAYFFQTKSYWDSISTGISGSAQGGFNASKLAGLLIPIPPLTEQKRIIAILDEAFAGIETAIANTEKNLANARELFESYLNAVFNKQDKDWAHTTVGKLVDEGIIEKPLDGNHGEIHPRKADFIDSGIPFIMAADLSEGRVNQETCHFISREQADTLRKGFAISGDVLLSHKGTIGRCAVLETNLNYVMLTPQVTYYRIKEKNTLYNRFLYYFFQSPEFLGELRRIAESGSTRSYIGITRQLELPISYPISLDWQKEYAGRFDELILETRRLESVYQQKLIALSELKQSLLQKAFSGELTAENVDDEVQEAVA